MTHREEIRTVAILGDPLCTAVAALRLFAANPDLTVFLPYDSLAQVEGDLFPMSPVHPEALHALEPVATLRWPGFMVIQDGEEITEDLPIGLIDPMQCLIELEKYDIQPATAAPQDATLLRIPALPGFTSASRMLKWDREVELELPVLYEALGDDSYRQHLPCGPGLVMVRERLGPAYNSSEYFSAHFSALGASTKSGRE